MPLRRGPKRGEVTIRFTEDEYYELVGLLTQVGDEKYALKPEDRSNALAMVGKVVSRSGLIR